MTDTSTMSRARAHLGALVRRAALARERITLTPRGQPAAVPINPQDRWTSRTPSRSPHTGPGRRPAPSTGYPMTKYALVPVWSASEPPLDTPVRSV
ncbi:hypothetical protein [Streptomyces sp. YGL11-2]|uniref:hypothetical protein n=1 Tax=Streptomyces sp. YGL11-2 TaxID=3414028 RepID=UPI003CE80404